MKSLNEVLWGFSSAISECNNDCDCERCYCYSSHCEWVDENCYEMQPDDCYVDGYVF